MRKPSVWTSVGVVSFVSTVFFMGIMNFEAHAAPVTLNFQSTINVLEGPLNGGPVSLGDTVTGSFTYESTTPLFEALGPVGRRYHALTNFQFTVGSYSASFSGSPSREINTFIVTPCNPFCFGSLNAITRDETGLVGPDINGYSLQIAGATLTSNNSFTTQQLLPPHPLPATLNDADFNTLGFDLGFFGPSPLGGNDTFRIAADPTVVPIPSSFFLFAAGLVGLVGWRKWSTKSA